MKEPTGTLMDNYAEFLQRLDAATESLAQRHDALLRVRAVLSSLLSDNQSGYQQWADRQVRVKGLLGSPDLAGGPGLQDLHAVAVNMESVFRTRSSNVAGRLASVQARINEIAGPLHDLHMSKQKLTTSRRIAEERENLSRVVQGAAGTAEGASIATPDAGLRDDLKAAREAVHLAEALLEVKGN